MIVARLEKGDGETILLMVLEPGNLEKLKQGQPIHKFLNEFLPHLPTKMELLFAYSPDTEWVAAELKRRGGISGDATQLAEVIHESLSRKPVIDR